MEKTRVNTYHKEDEEFYDREMFRDENLYNANLRWRDNNSYELIREMEGDA